MTRAWIPFGLVIALLVATAAAVAIAADESEGDEVVAAETETADEDEEAKKDALTLERLFPEKSFWGTRTRGNAFSFDGKYAAYLYKPYAERRHGDDLWIFTSETGEVRRVTSVSVMSEFQADTRKVKEDRVKKARKAKKDGDEGEDAESLAELRKKGDWVSDEDADDEKAPRYRGIENYVWSPVANELILSSQGDLYRYQVEEDVLTRLTVTATRESAYQYARDGGGYTYIREGALTRVTFGSHLVEELEPDLPGGEEMTGYRISPDGSRLAFVTSKAIGQQPPGAGATLVNYEGRFAEAYEVGRHVSDDPLGKSEWSVYLWDLADLDVEENEPVKVYTIEREKPRDMQHDPVWAPDSSRVCFAVYSQDTRKVEIFEAVFPASAKPEKDSEDADKPESEGVADAGAEDEAEEEAENDSEDEKPDEPVKAEARAVTQFLHNGGPSTPYVIRPYYMPDSRRMIILSEQSGFRHVYAFDPLYETFEPLTSGHYEVDVLEVTDSHEWLFLRSSERGTMHLDAVAVHLPDGAVTRLTPLEGRYEDISVSPDAKHVLARYYKFGVLPELVHVDVEKGTQTPLTDSETEEARKLTEPIPEFFEYQNRQGHTIHGMMFKPANWKPEDKRPLIIHVYGGPLDFNGKSVVEGSYGGDNYFFSYYMTKVHGYVTVTLDPRGQSGYGAVFEKANFEQPGKPQAEDIVDGIKWLSENHGVDPARAGVYGWSFGGFQTQACLYFEPDSFACGIAGAGPTEWENYNSWYTQGVIGDTRQGEPDIAEHSLVPHAKNLKGRLLLVHGMRDDNVLFQDTVKIYAALLDAHKETQVELFLDPSGGHGMYGHVKPLATYRKYEEFFTRVLGDEGPETGGEPVTLPSAPAEESADAESGVGDDESRTTREDLGGGPV